MLICCHCRLPVKRGEQIITAYTPLLHRRDGLPGAMCWRCKAQAGTFARHTGADGGEWEVEENIVVMEERGTREANEVWTKILK